MNEQQEQWQQEDEKSAFMRCMELVRMAQRGQVFSQQDIEDLIYFLGIKEHFK